MKQFIKFYTKYTVFVVLLVSLVFNTFSLVLADSNEIEAKKNEVAERDLNGESGEVEKTEKYPELVNPYFANNNIYIVDEYTRNVTIMAYMDSEMEKDNNFPKWAIHVFAQQTEARDERGIKYIHTLSFGVLANGEECIAKYGVGKTATLKFDVWGLGTANTTWEKMSQIKNTDIRLKSNFGTTLVSLNDLNTVFNMNLSGYDFNNYDYWLKTIQPYMDYREIIKIRK